MEYMTVKMAVMRKIVRVHLTSSNAKVVPVYPKHIAVMTTETATMAQMRLTVVRNVDFTWPVQKYR